MKSMVLLAICLSLFTTNSIGQPNEPKYGLKITMNSRGSLNCNVTISNTEIFNHDDSVFMLLTEFITRKLDATLINEEFKVCPDNGKGVAIIAGPRHQIFFAVSRNGEQILLILGGRKPIGGILIANDDEWKLDSQQITENGIYTFIGGNNPIHGRFEFKTKQIADVEFDDGLPNNYKKK